MRIQVCFECVRVRMGFDHTGENICHSTLMDYCFPTWIIATFEQLKWFRTTTATWSLILRIVRIPDWGSKGFSSECCTYQHTFVASVAIQWWHFRITSPTLSLNPAAILTAGVSLLKHLQYWTPNPCHLTLMACKSHHYKSKLNLMWGLVKMDNVQLQIKLFHKIIEVVLPLQVSMR